MIINNNGIYNGVDEESWKELGRDPATGYLLILILKSTIYCKFCALSVGFVMEDGHRDIEGFHWDQPTPRLNHSLSWQSPQPSHKALH